MYILLLLIFSIHSFALKAYTGTGLAGGITLNGVLKATLLNSKIPLGGVSSYYGYEALDYPNSTPLYCFGSVGLSSGNSVVGLNLGGQYNKIATIGKCDSPEDYKGGFLSVGLAYQIPTDSTANFDVQAYVNLGFDLDHFNQSIINGFRANESNKDYIQKRLGKVVWHFSKYLAKKGSSKSLEHASLLKFLILPILPAVGPDWQSAFTSMKWQMSDLKFSQDKNSFKSLKTKVRDLFYGIRKDAAFYQCKSDRCEDLFLDSYIVMDAIEDALGNCHSLSAGASSTVGYDLKLPILNSNFSFSFAYSYYGIQEILKPQPSMSLAASKAFAKHRFIKKSASCDGVEKIAANSFGDFLTLLSTKRR